MRIYLAGLDTVRFSIDNVTTHYEYLEKRAYAEVIISRALYDEITFSPNQVLDLRLMQVLLKKISNYSKFSFSIPRGYEYSNTIWLDILIEILSRDSKNSFLFSSVIDSKRKRELWKEYIKNNPTISDKEIIANAERIGYNEVIQWAKKLDKDYSRKIKINELVPKNNFGLIYTTVLPIYLIDFHSFFLNTEVATRSALYEKIETVIEEDIREKELSYANIASQIDNSQRCNSRLLFPIDRKNGVKVNFKNISDDCLIIDFSYLFDEIPEIIEGIWDAKEDLLSKAYIEFDKIAKGELIKLERKIDGKEPDLIIIEKGLKIFFSLITGCNISSGFISTSSQQKNSNKDTLVTKIKNLDHFIYNK